MYYLLLFFGVIAFFSVLAARLPDRRQVIPSERNRPEQRRDQG